MVSIYLYMGEKKCLYLWSMTMTKSHRCLIHFDIFMLLSRKRLAEIDREKRV